MQMIKWPLPHALSVSERYAETIVTAYIHRTATIICIMSVQIIESSHS